jgi:hypothetical protein
LVVEAICEKRFWIFTDDQFDEPIAERHRSIEVHENPAKSPTLVDYLLR